MEVNVLKNLKSLGTFNIFNAIVSCVNQEIISQEIITALQSLKNDKRLFAGYKISDFSTAALSILNVNKYTGNDEDIKTLINSKLKFN